MTPKVIAPPTQPLISAADLRTHCRLADDGSEDGLVLPYLYAAHAFAEHYTGRAIGTQTLELALDCFPTGAIELPRGKVTSISSVKYIDTSGVEQTVSTSDYSLDDYSVPCRVVPAFNVLWPDTRLVDNAVKVRYVAGDLTDAVKSALLLITGHLYENRQDVVVDARVVASQVPMGATALLDTVKVYG